jgi:hypothetical protein
VILLAGATGLTRRLEAVPFHCRIRVPLPEEPLAHASLAEIAATSSSIAWRPARHRRSFERGTAPPAPCGRSSCIRCPARAGLSSRVAAGRPHGLRPPLVP